MLSILIGLFSYNLCAQSKEITKKDIKLVVPNFNEEAKLYDALKNRRSSRSFSKEKISDQDMSNLLWAAAGINRDGGGRTVPLLGDIAIYVAMESGVYLYNANTHELEHKITNDIRRKISSQAPVKQSPVIFIYTIDDKSFPRYMKDAMIEAHGMDFYYGNQVAYSTQNIYLYAATNNMNAVVIGGFFREKVDEIIDLDNDHNAYLIQLVGYKPK